MTTTGPHARSAKDQARLAARAVRDALTDPAKTDPAERDAAVLAVADRVAALPLPPGEVGGYWPLGSELDVRPALLRLRQAGRAAALPVSGPRGTSLTFRDWDPALPLVAGRYGILEPGDDRPERWPTVILVPLLAFDRSGHRLGYGAGYYDRTLAALRARHPVVAVGCAFAVQEVPAVPAADHDERLDWIVTERATLRIAR